MSSRSVSTDSYPKLYKSFSTKPSSSTIPSTRTSPPTSISIASSSPSASTAPQRPPLQTTHSTVPPRLHWDQEAQVAGRPYDFRDYNTPFKRLPAYLSELGGLGIPARKPCQPSPKPDPFRKRTQPDEIFHKRVTDASTFSITERPRSMVCVGSSARKPKSPLEHVRGVLLADNVNSEEESERRSDVSEPLTDLSWEACRDRPKKDEMLRECKRAFFQARKELFKIRQYDEYVEDKNRKPVEVESWEISSESSEEVQEEEEDEFIGKQEEKVVEVEDDYVDEYHSTEIMREEEKQTVQEHRQAHLEQVREVMWSEYAQVDRLEEEERARRALSPDPVDPEEMMRNVPEQDFLNKEKQLKRDAIAARLEEIRLSQLRVPKQLPQTAAQFEKYTDELMRARRELRDEAVLVDEHYRKAGLEVDVPEKDLQLRKFRAADYKSEESEEEVEVDSDAPEEGPVVHTCMTRLEWSRWIGKCTVVEKLRLPKVKIPRLPRTIHKAKESPIGMYIRGRQQKQAGIQEEIPERKIDEKRAKKPQSIKWNLRDYLYEEPQEHRISKFVPYKPPTRPFPELAEDSFKLKQVRRRRRRELRKNHMAWIDELVDEICAKN